ncbi:MAG: hypothetical protein Q7S09_04120 [bacterium]|nr:hypothetical protein [bacterium]
MHRDTIEEEKISHALDFASWYFTLFVDILSADVYTIQYRNLKKSRVVADRVCVGQTVFDTHAILIDRRRGDATRTLVHELCHVVLEPLVEDFHELITENRVTYLETLLWEAFSDRQKRVLRAFLPLGRRKSEIKIRKKKSKRA